MSWRECEKDFQKPRKLLLIGGGGHCRSILDCLCKQSLYSTIGIVEKNSKYRSILGIPIVGEDADLIKLKNEGWTDAFIAVGSVGDCCLRRQIFDLISKIGFNIPCIVDSTAIIANDVVIAQGVFVGKMAVVNAGSSIGACSIINTGAIIEHNCNIGEFSHVSSGVVLCGDVKIGINVHIGAGSAIKQTLTVGDNSVVGLGSVVVKNIPQNVIAYGNPCIVREKR